MSISRTQKVGFSPLYNFLTEDIARQSIKQSNPVIYSPSNFIYLTRSPTATFSKPQSYLRTSNNYQYSLNSISTPDSKPIRTHKPTALKYTSGLLNSSKLSNKYNSNDQANPIVTTNASNNSKIFYSTMSIENTSTSSKSSINETFIAYNSVNNHDSNKFKNRIAVAIDIDGVLVYGNNAMKGAKEALELLHENKIPFVLLTNGGGKTQSKKSKDLHDILGYYIDPQYIQLCHTPLSDLAKKYQNQLVLLVGGGDLEGVAKEVGFTDYVTAQQYLQLRPNCLPFRKPLDTNKYQENESDEKKVKLEDLQKIKAAFVMHDSTDWQLDIQVLSDVFRENKHLSETISRSTFMNNTQHSEEATKNLNNCLSNPSKHIPFYATNADFIFGSSHRLPRYAQGAFTRAFVHLYEQLTGISVEAEYFGKPQSIVYDYAYELLNMQNETNSTDDSDLHFDYIYAIGDNPKSDVRGANMKGHPWISILVKTGIFNGAENDAEDPAQIVCDNILDAVNQIIQENKITNRNAN